MDDSDSQPPAPGGAGYWFTPVPIYLIEASIDPESPVNGPAIVLWAHLHRHYAWRRRMFPAHSTLAKETNQSDSAVRRQLNALRDAGALTWGAKYGQKGRTSNDYALALHRPFEFDREIGTEVTVKNDSHPPVTVKSDGGVDVKNDQHPTVKNERVVEEHRVSRDLSPHLPRQPQEPAAAPVEREISIPDDTRKVVDAWIAARGGRRNSSAEASVAKSARSLMADGWSIPDLIALAEDMARKYPRGTDLRIHEQHWQPPASAEPKQPCTSSCDPVTFLITTPDGDMDPCPTCHPVGRRRAQQGTAA